MEYQPALKWPEQGNARVPYRVFSDPEIYRGELDRVFLGPTWQFLALAGDLPEPGDYLTTFLGETPVIVTRGTDGEMHAMVNRCAHRGNRSARRGTRRSDCRHDRGASGRRGWTISATSSSAPCRPRPRRSATTSAI